MNDRDFITHLIVKGELSTVEINTVPLQKYVKDLKSIKDFYKGLFNKGKEVIKVEEIDNVAHVNGKRVEGISYSNLHNIVDKYITIIISQYVCDYMNKDEEYKLGFIELFNRVYKVSPLYACDNVEKIDVTEDEVVGIESKDNVYGNPIFIYTTRLGRKIKASLKDLREKYYEMNIEYK